MTTNHATSTLTDPADPARTADAVADLDTHGPAPLDQRIFEAAVASLEILSIHLGRRLGLYAGVSAPGGVTPTSWPPSQASRPAMPSSGSSSRRSLDS